MNRPYATDEQYERWYIIDCARCGRHRHKAASWPDGPICRTCADRAVRTRGTCPGCGQERALPGRRPGDTVAICTTCAGFTQSIACSRCGAEGKLHGGRLCTRCTFADRLAELLDDGTGRIRPELSPLAEHLLAMNNPLTGLTWLYPPQGPPRPRRPAACPRPRGDRADPRRVPHPAALASRRPPARTAGGLRGAAPGRQADLLVRTVADRPSRRHQRPRPRPDRATLRHLARPATPACPSRAETDHRGQPRSCRRPSHDGHGLPPVALRTRPDPVHLQAGRPSTSGTPSTTNTPGAPCGLSCSGAPPPASPAGSGCLPT